MNHPLVHLAQWIDWQATAPHFEHYYCADNGRSGLQLRLQIGLQLLKHMHSLSDEQVVMCWVEKIMQLLQLYLANKRKFYSSQLTTA